MQMTANQSMRESSHRLEGGMGLGVGIGLELLINDIHFSYI